MYERVASNRRKSWALLVGFALLTVAVGWAFGYLTGSGFLGLGFALVLVGVMSATSYWGSDRIALAISRASPADPVEHAQLHNVVEALALGAGMPKPRVYVVEDPAPNAFATGRDPEHAAIAVTTGLLGLMSRDELEGVLAHELSHVRNRDTLVMTIAVVLVGAIVLLADIMLRSMFWGGMLGGGRRGGSRRESGGGLGIALAVLGLALLIVAPVIAQVMKFAISRRREYLADADAVLLTRYPPGLIGALEKLRDDTTVVRSASRATAHLWIEEPIPRQAHEGGSATPGGGAWLNRLFTTHPPLDERIAALREGVLPPL